MTLASTSHLSLRPSVRKHVRNRILLTSCVAAVALCAAAPSAPAATRSVPKGFYGAVYDGAVTSAAPAVQDEQFARMAQAGVESVRAVFSWADAQPNSG